jgi:hypothetical protein
MEGKFNELELEWIKGVLELHGEYLGDKLIKAITNKPYPLISTGSLVYSIKPRVRNYGLNPVLHVSFLSYGRAVEIRNNKSNNTKKFQKSRANLQYNYKGHKTGKRDTKWYAGNAYGSLNTLIAVLMHEFTHRERKHIKDYLQYM